MTNLYKFSNGTEQMTKPFLSIVIPVYNGEPQLRRCLEAIQQSIFTNWELIVVDDGSTDGSDALARSFKAKLLTTGGRLGPAAARNLGAKAARGDYLFFIDADCEIHSDTLANIAQVFGHDPALDALFGSYDDNPAAPNFMAQYKNLFHHYVHQNGYQDASTFWTGCGAIKRSQFLALGGFDLQRYRRPSVEDIDLGYRLTQRGGRIRLAKHVQVKHLKAWTFASLLKSDIFDRGIPWTRLILRGNLLTSDLNLQIHNRISVLAIYGLLLALVVSVWLPAALVITLGLAIILFWLNSDLYRFFYQKRGLLFTLGVVPMHWLYYIYNAISFGTGLLLHWQEKLKAEAIPSPEPLSDSLDVDRSS
jgi:glycosyltransferase involved in cell wall biosynthesis